MPKTLKKDDILGELVRTLLDGWGEAAVIHAIEEAKGNVSRRGRSSRRSRGGVAEVPGAAEVVEALAPGPTKDLLRRFAEDFDRGDVLPRIPDVRRFLAAHNVKLGDVKSRNQAFKIMLPALCATSEKGLLRMIERARYSGPAQLDQISEAIKGAGEQRPFR